MAYYCNCVFVRRPTNCKYNKNLIQLNPDPAGLYTSDIRIRYPAENQYQSIASYTVNFAAEGGLLL